MSGTANDYALEISGLCKSFGGLPVTQDVSLAVRPGERRLIIGPNGAGKTTLFNQITGEIRPNAGTIKLFGRDVTRFDPQTRAHHGLSRTYQIITLFPNDTVQHNICLGIMGLRPARWHMFKPLTAYPDVIAEARRVLDLVGLSDLAGQTISSLAYGEKRRIEIAMALAQNPRVLLLDEPLAGLSSAERATIKSLIVAIPRSTTIVIIEHDMDTALNLADTVTLLHYGKVIIDGERDEVIAHEKTREVYLGQ